MEITSNKGQALSLDPSRQYILDKPVAVLMSHDMLVTLHPVPSLHAKQADFMLGMMLSVYYWLRWCDIFGAV